MSISPTSSTVTRPCVFCVTNPYGKAVIDKQIVFKTDFWHVILDYKPVTKGHFIITPIAHRANRFEITSEENADLFNVQEKIKQIYLGVFNSAVNIQYEKNGAGIPHFQIHVIPNKGSILSRIWLLVKLAFYTVGFPFPTLKEDKLKKLSLDFNKFLTQSI